MEERNVSKKEMITSYKRNNFAKILHKHFKHIFTEEFIMNMANSITDINSLKTVHSIDVMDKYNQQLMTSRQFLNLENIFKGFYIPNFGETTTKLTYTRFLYDEKYSNSNNYSQYVYSVHGDQQSSTIFEEIDDALQGYYPVVNETPEYNATMQTCDLLMHELVYEPTRLYGTVYWKAIYEVRDICEQDIKEDNENAEIKES